MSNEALKPCPFPHKENASPIIELTQSQDYMTGWQVRCIICGARGPIAKTRKKAIAAWNKRAEEKNNQHD
jgi:Lar family restriction alleviation protein